MSNPMFSLFITPLLLLFLWEYFHRPRAKLAVFIGLFFGLLIQSDVAFGVFLFILPLYYWLFEQKIILKDVGRFIFGLVIGLATFILAEIKFSGRTSLALLNFVLRNESSNPASGALFQLFDRTADFLSFTVLPFPKLLVIILVLLLIRRLNFSSKPVAFLLIWLANIIIFQFFSSGVSGSGFVYAPSLAALVVLAACMLGRYKWLVIIIFVAQMGLNLKWVKNNYSPMAVQTGVTLTAEEKAVDYTYQQAVGAPFIIVSLTNPLYINTNWAYLYEFYGQNKYGYLPYWAGKNQAGYLGNLPDKKFDTQLRFLIMEHVAGIPDVYVAKTIYEEDKFSDILEERKFSGITVQKRTFHLNKPPIPIPAELQLAPKILAE